MMDPKNFPVTATNRRLAMTPLERRAGRWLRSPDGHGDAGGAGDLPAADAGGGAAVVEGGEGEDAGQADDTTVLGGAGAGSEGAEGEAEPGEEGKGGDEAAAAGAPEKYELSAPEGFTLDPEALAAAEPIFREIGLDNEAAQKLMPAAATFGQRMFDAGAKQAGDTVAERAATARKEWSDAFDADPEFGGTNRARTVAEAARAFDHYGIKAGEGVRKLLNESGLGNHPDLIRFVARVGRDLGEGTFETGAAASQPKSGEQKLYGDEFQPKT